MTPLQLPPAVPGHGWPILSAVRYGTSEQPAEYIVVVDCGEGTPTERYATMHVFVFPDRIKFRDGEYDLTFAQATRSLAARAGLSPSTIEVLVVRDPDDANDYTVFVDGRHRPDGTTDTVRVVTHDVDLGAAEITPAWVAEQLRRADDTLSPAAARRTRDAITAYAHIEDPAAGA